MLRYVSFFMAIMMASGSVLASSATAGVAGTGELLTEQRADLDRQPLLGMLERDEVKDRLAQIGVSPDQVEERYQCGPASLARMLNSQGLNTNPDVLKEMVYLPERQGSLKVELVAAVALRRGDGRLSCCLPANCRQLPNPCAT